MSIRTNLFLLVFITILINFQAFAAAMNSFELIEDDLLNKKITNSQAVLYRALAFRGDLDLPSQYLGDPNAPYDREKYTDSLISEVHDIVNDLSLAESILAVRLIAPPAYVPERKPQVKNLKSSFKILEEELPTPTPGVSWEYLDILEARIWFKSFDPRAVSFAENAAVSFPLILQKLKEISDHDPLKDNSQSYKITLNDGREVTIGDGGNGKIDIYIMPFDTRRDVYAYYQPFKSSLSKDPTPGYIVVNSTLNRNNREFNSTLMHETMHLIQYTYGKKQAHATYSKIGEGVAMWAENYWDSTSQFEHPYKDFFINGKNSLKDASYGTWTFYYYLSKTFGHKIIDRIYNTMSSYSPYEAIDKTISGGFKKVWPEYTRKEWNQYPADEQDGFKKWDDYSDVPHEPNGTEIKTKEVVIDPTIGDYVFTKTVSLKPLTRAYFDFEFTKPEDTHSVSIGMTHYWKKSKVTLKALIETDSGWRVEQWDSQYEDKQICFDKKSDRIKRMVLIYSNFDYRDGVAPVEFEAHVSATNLGCLGYRGSSIAHLSSRSADGSSYEMQVNSSSEFRARESTSDDPTSGPHFPGQFYLKNVSGSLTYRVIDSKKCVGNLSTRFQVANDQGKETGVIGLYPFNNRTTNNYRLFSMAIGHPKDQTFPLSFVCPDPKDNYTIGAVFSPLETGIQSANPKSGDLVGTYLFNGMGKYEFNFQPIVE